MHLPAGFDRGDPLARAFDRAEHSVNIGADGLVMTFAYPADSGQDYAIIEEAGGMRSRVVDDGEGGWRLIDNTRYRGRQAERIARVFASAS